MPQANITYDTRYNRDLASRVNQMEDAALFQNKHQYHPSPMGYRMGDFHNAQGTANTPNIARDYQHGGRMTGGVAGRKFILNGNSPAYPPINMKAGLAVSSGGGRGSMAGIDGAVSGGNSGGSFMSDFKKGFDGVMDSGKKAASTAAALAPIAIMASKAMSGGVPSGGVRAPRGRPAKGHVGRVKGGNLFKDIAGLAAKVAPIALPLLTGLGRKATMGDKRKAIADAIVGGNFWDGFKKGFGDVMDLAGKVAPIALPLMTGLGKKQYGGAFNFGKFLEKVGKAAAPVLLQEGKKQLGLGRKRKGSMYPPKGGAMVGNKTDACGRHSGTREYGAPCGGNLLDDVIEATKPMVRKGKKALKDAVKEYAPKATKALKEKADKAITKAVGGGRAARAEIVKKVMKDKGMKMIEASKYVKEHGLYKK
jgi:hypothetical protein